MSYSKFEDQLKAAATGVFGSGWAWLVVDGNKLAIEQYPNQDSPISKGKKPLLGIDVWEHAYYLKYENRRAEYLAAITKVINWDFVSGRYDQLGKMGSSRPGGVCLTEPRPSWSVSYAFNFSRCSRSTALRLSLILLPSSAEHLHQDLVAFFQLVPHVLDTVLADFADVQQAVGTREDLNKRAEFHQPHNLAQIGLVDLSHGSDVGDPLDGLLGRFPDRQRIYSPFRRLRHRS